MRCFPYEIDTILTNLISNSTASFEKIKTSEKKIYVDVKTENEYIRIDYSVRGLGWMQYIKIIQKRRWKYLKRIREMPVGKK